jgi:hypothetical protein
MSIKLYKDARTVRIWKCIQFRRQGGEERGGRGHALPLVYLKKRLTVQPFRVKLLLEVVGYFFYIFK